MSFKYRSLISISDLSKQEILNILKRAEVFKKKPPKEVLKGSILASCFFEPSTRTRLSFESAMHRLGGDVIGFSESSSTSAKKGETLVDSMRVIGAYADVIVLRHALEGSARCASEVTSTPVINAGDGANQHPTQTLTDLFTIKECQGKLQTLSIGLFGDLKYSRTAHSLTLAASLFGIQLYFISPEPLTLPDYICRGLRKNGVKFSFHRSLEEVIGKLDILYVTRLQKERFDEGEYHQISQYYTLHKSMLNQAKKTLKILSPLPRVNEIDLDIDATPFAYYFQQAANGLFVRQALLTLLLNK